MQTKIWEQNLEAIGVHKAGIEKVINLASKSALEQCHFMYQAREAALMQGEIQTIPRQVDEDVVGECREALAGWGGEDRQSDLVCFRLQLWL